MNLEFLPEARFEFYDAEFYEDNESGLGKRFRDEIAHGADDLIFGSSA